MRRTDLIEYTRKPSLREAAGAPGHQHCEGPSKYYFA